MSERSPWRVRPFAPGDETPLTELFERVFGGTMTAAHYRWKLVDVPQRAPAPNVWVAEADGRIVGQYAASPVRFRLERGVVTALHGCDVMTDPAWRGRGVLTDLGTRAHRVWREAGIPFVYGLHYGGWGSRREHLDWREMFSARWMWHPLDGGRLLERRLPGPPALARLLGLPVTVGSAASGAIAAVRGGNVKVEAVGNEAGQAFDALWSSLATTHDAHVVRDRSRVGHRYLAKPEGAYEVLLAHRQDGPCGFLVYGIHDGRGALLDLFTGREDGETRAALLAEALRTMRGRGVRQVRALTPLRGPLTPALLAAGFLPARGRYDVSLVWLGEGSVPPELTSPSRWFTTGGDFDVL